MKKYWCLIISLVNLFLFVCLFWALYKQPGAHFSGTNITDLLAIVVSCISIVITILFVVLAINAYGRIREIEKNAENAKTSSDKAKTCSDKAKTSSEKAIMLVQEIKETSESAIQSLRRIGDANRSFYESTLEIIDMVGRSNISKKTKERNQKWRKDIEINFYRMGLYPYFLDDSTRESFILSLSVFGDKTDIEPLKRIIESKDESEKIKKSAKTVLDDLIKKYT